jgi:hypothetical protein
MTNKWLLLCFFLMSSALAQDERYYRQILKGELPQIMGGFKESVDHQFNVMGPSYHIDLNGDGIEESIQPQKRDGIDWIEIKAANKSKLFEAQLLAMGTSSVLYKVKLVSLSSSVKALVLFLDEGVTQGRKFESTARIFVISYENNDLASMQMTAGPHFFHEKEFMRDQYTRRDYLVNVVDFNRDGKKEISIQYHHIQRIMEYLGDGEWRRY